MSIEVSCQSCGKVLKAKDSAAGKKARCPECGDTIHIPEAVYDAEEDWGDDYGDDQYGFSDDEISDAPADYDANRKPCPMCGEMIVTDAAKCRYCGEVFDSRLKKQRKSRASASSDDSDLSTAEWVVAILCSGIGCICGIVWMIQGKPKGAKMLGVSILAAIFWNVLKVIIAAIAQNA